MKAIILAAALFAPLASAAAADRVPHQFVGDWCIDQNAKPTVSGSSDIAIYGRSRSCETAEESMIVRPNSLFIAGEVECKLPQIVSVAGHETRLKFRCRHVDGETWNYDLWIWTPDRNTLGTREVKPAAVSMGTPVMAANKVTCEGTLEHGSGGEYIGLKPQCWLGSMEEVENAVLAVCKPFEHCKITGIATTCEKIMIATYVWKSSS